MREEKNELKSQKIAVRNILICLFHSQDTGRGRRVIGSLCKSCTSVIALELLQFNSELLLSGPPCLVESTDGAGEKNYWSLFCVSCSAYRRAAGETVRDDVGSSAEIARAGNGVQ